MFDLFAGYSWDELAYQGELFVMGIMILGSVFAVGAVDGSGLPPARVPSKKF